MSTFQWFKFGFRIENNTLWKCLAETVCSLTNFDMLALILTAVTANKTARPQHPPSSPHSPMETEVGS